jgi:pimeloyl-ACP methyl ester carboxylesterase
VSLVNPLGLTVPGHPAKDLWFVRDPERLLFTDPVAAPAVPNDEQVANAESAARYGWSPRLHDPTLAPRAHRIGKPVQLIWGTEDQLLPKEHLARWREVLPRSEVVEIPAVGHFPGYERPDLTVAAIEALIRENSSPENSSRENTAEYIDRESVS